MQPKVDASKSNIHNSKMTTLFILTLLVSSPVFGQRLIKKYKSPPGYYTTESQIIDDYSNRMDFDGDGRPEMVLEQVNDQGVRIDLFVVDPEDLDVLWHLDEAELAELGVHVPEEFPIIGFFSFSASDDEVRVAVFGGSAAGVLIHIDPRSNQILFVFPENAGKAAGTDTLRFAIFDIDGDDYVDLIVSDPATQTVQVWGAQTTSTATEDDIEAALSHLLQNYPNPFRTSTTITYEVEQPGPVRVTVYDALGRKVKTLVDAQQPVGSHHVTWDGRDAGGQAVAAGTYFYRLRVGEAVMSKQAIRIK